MSVVYITEQGSSIKKGNGKLIISKGDNDIRWIHINDIEQLIILGNITITAPVITYLLKNKIDTIFLSYYGKYKGRLLGEFGKNIDLRLTQYKVLSDKEKSLNLAREIVRAKLSNQINILRKRNRRLSSDSVAEVIFRIRMIEKKELNNALTTDSLRGQEGISAKYYFSVFNELLSNQDFIFTTRNRRPPRDEINALLSLGYTLLMNQTITQINICGLDPFYGALHEVDYGRQSLALDLMEEFRPLIDDLIITAVNKKIIRKEHFKYNKTDEEDPETTTELPVMLTQDGMRKFVRIFNDLMESTFFVSEKQGNFALKDIIYLQCRKYIDHLYGKTIFSQILPLF